MPTSDTPFLGRDEELDLLRRVLARSIAEPSVQLVTVTGEPGVGKTRLALELREREDGARQGMLWLTGRSRPQEESTFSALRQVVRAYIGISDSDGAAQVAARLRGVLATLAASTPEIGDRDWLEARLSALVGVGRTESATVDRAETFAAWRAFLEAVASRQPLGLLFEDLHWAEPGLLAFIEHVVDWSVGVPLLILCAARPEIFEHHSSWGGGKRNATTITLSPLTREETAHLISSLVLEAVLPPGTQAAVLERAEGNPFYAEEFVRMLADQGILERRHGHATIAGGDIPVPQSVHGLIAARLDGLDSGHRGLLRDASVIGRVFWSGAVAALGDVKQPEAAGGLHDLARKALVEPSRTSSVRDQEEYAFTHALIQEVAYGQLGNDVKAVKHRAAAEWIERVAGELSGESAELLAHHHARALAALRAEERPSREIQEEEDQLRRFLLQAGDRAVELDVERAASYYRRALELIPAGHPDHGRALLKKARADHVAGRFAPAEADARAAMEAFRGRGDDLGAGEAMVELSRLLWLRGDTGRAHTLLSEAILLLERQPPGPELTRAYVAVAGELMVAARSAECLATSEKALAMARSFGMEDQAMRALQFRGTARCELGDLEGLQDLREALRRSVELGLGRESAFAYINLADWVWRTEGPAAGLAVYAEGIDFAERRGLIWLAYWMRTETAWVMFDLGEWDKLIRVADEVLAWDREHGEGAIALTAQVFKAGVLMARGEAAGMESVDDEFLSRARKIGDPQILVPALATGALIHAARGEVADGVRLIHEFEEITADRPVWRAHELPIAVRILLAGGEVDRARSLLEDVRDPSARGQHSLTWSRAILAEAGNDLVEATSLFQEAAERWGEFGHVLARGHCLLGAGRCLLDLDDPERATRLLESAREVFERLGAAPFLLEAERLLETASTPRSV